MPYQNDQPLGNNQRRSGGGWRALQLMSKLGDSEPLTLGQQTAYRAGAGPVSPQGAEDYFGREAAFNQAVGTGNYGVLSPMSGSQYVNRGYTAGTGAPPPKGSSY